MTAWPLRYSEFELHAVHRGGIKTLAADAISLPETGGSDTTKLDDVLEERGGGSLVGQRRERINDDHDGYTDIRRIWQQDNSVVTVLKG